jgi:mannose-6-phosphate isomerase-like protein (cupin superfamily)
MKTVSVTPQEMQKRTVRYSRLESYQQQHEKLGIPDAAFDTVAARRVYPIMVPENYSGRSAMAPMKGAPGLAVTIAECPPGNGAGLHAHEQSVENFFCLDGRFEIAWGDTGEHSTVLEPMDFISIPPGVC